MHSKYSNFCDLKFWRLTSEELETDFFRTLQWATSGKWMSGSGGQVSFTSKTCVMTSPEASWSKNTQFNAIFVSHWDANPEKKHDVSDKFLMLIWQSSMSVSEMQIPSHQMIKIPSVLLSISRINRPPQPKTWENNSNLLKLFQWNKRKCAFFFLNQKKHHPIPSRGHEFTNQGLCSLKMTINVVQKFDPTGPIEWPNPLLILGLGWFRHSQSSRP